MTTTSRISATYQIETPYNIGEVADIIAREASTGTFVPLPGETPQLRECHGATVDDLINLGQIDSPSLPSAMNSHITGKIYNKAQVTISYPLHNTGPSIPNLMATIAGGVFDLGQLTAVRLVELKLPDEFGQANPGPQFGVTGTRELTGVYSRPIIGTIMKPSVGMTPEQTAETTRVLIEAGIDFIKDDECMANPPHSPFKDRVKAVMRVINELSDRRGRKAMYAFNITGDIDEMVNHHDTVLEAGGTCVMVSINYVGLAGLAYLRKRSRLPIHAHRNGWGALSRYPKLGMDFQPYQTIWRLAGVDHMHCSGIRNKFWDSDDTVVSSAKACLEPIINTAPVMPVLASGQWAGQAVDTYLSLGSTDLMYVCGGGVLGHPDGLAAGVLSVQQAWQAATGNLSLEEYAEEHVELARALERFGK